MSAKTRWEAIDEMVDLLVADGAIQQDKRQSSLDALVAREKQMSTGVGFGVGIPHASTPAVSEVVLGIGLSEAGIQFDALDNKPVHIVVVLLVPSSQHQQHLKTLASISKLLNEKKFREELRKSDSESAVCDLFKSRLK